MPNEVLKNEIEESEGMLNKKIKEWKKFMRTHLALAQMFSITGSAVAFGVKSSITTPDIHVKAVLDTLFDSGLAAMAVGGALLIGAGVIARELSKKQEELKELRRHQETHVVNCSIKKEANSNV